MSLSDSGRKTDSSPFLQRQASHTWSYVSRMGLQMHLDADGDRIGDVAVEERFVVWWLRSLGSFLFLECGLERLVRAVVRLKLFHDLSEIVNGVTSHFSILESYLLESGLVKRGGEFENAPQDIEGHIAHGNEDEDLWKSEAQDAIDICVFLEILLPAL